MCCLSEKWRWRKFLQGFVHNNSNSKLRTQTFRSKVFQQPKQKQQVLSVKTHWCLLKKSQSFPPTAMFTSDSCFLFLSVKQRITSYNRKIFRFMRAFFEPKSFETLVTTLEAKDCNQLSEPFPKDVNIPHWKKVFRFVSRPFSAVHRKIVASLL